MDKQLKDLLKFTEFTNLFAGVYRKTIINKDGSAENNAQHSFQTALVGWYICDKEKLKLDITKIIKYSLVHDLMETYSGTYPAYQRDSATQQDKEAAEAHAIQKIKTEFKEFTDLVINLDEYLKLENEESKFVYALDKLLPIINIELNNNDFYFKTQTTFEDMMKTKDLKISKDPTVYKYFELLKKYLNGEAKFFWPENRQRDYSEKIYGLHLNP